MDTIGKLLLKNIAFYRSYSETLKNGKKETIKETFDRVKKMHTEKFPDLANVINEIFEQSIYTGRVVPSMRSMQFAGNAIKRSNVRIYNCAFTSIESFKDIADTVWISMNGAGIGYSIQDRHISKLPKISVKYDEEHIIIEDSKEGWADSVIFLLENPLVEFNYSRVRKKGKTLSTGGTASGPESLQDMHEKIRSILLPCVGRKLRSIEVHDIMCHIGDLIICGGVRRTAFLSLFDEFDEDMLKCKQGDWFTKNPQRARANNSAIIHRQDPLLKEKIAKVLKACFESNSGEPAVFLTNDWEYGCNPCAEIGMRPRTFCNLTEVNVAACNNEEEFYKSIEHATILGTLQCAYTNFSYIDSRWKKNCEQDALLGVSITGQAQAQHLMTPDILEKCGIISLRVNEEYARKININPAARIGCVKPSGTTSAFLGTTSGIHAAHSKFYLRRVRIDQHNPLAKFFIEKFGLYPENSNNIVEKDVYSSDSIVITMPIKESENVIIRGEESPIELLERAKSVYTNWIHNSHRRGSNTHSVSLTVSYKNKDIELITNWMINNSSFYSGVSLLPYDGGDYTQTPFESISEDCFKKWVDKYSNIDLNFESINFKGSQDTRKSESACSGGACELS